MHTIKIQNYTDYKDSIFKLFVNGEMHVARHLTYKLQVDEGKAFRIRAKYIWSGSPEYTFEPKENMILQILPDRQTRKWRDVLFASYAILTSVLSIYNVFLDRLLIAYLIFLLIFLCCVIYAIIGRKMGFVIKEVDQQSTNDVNQ